MDIDGTIQSDVPGWLLITSEWGSRLTPDQLRDAIDLDGGTPHILETLDRIDQRPSGLILASLMGASDRNPAVQRALRQAAQSMGQMRSGGAITHSRIIRDPRLTGKRALQTSSGSLQFGNHFEDLVQQLCHAQGWDGMFQAIHLHSCSQDDMRDFLKMCGTSCPYTPLVILDRPCPDRVWQKFESNGWNIQRSF